MLTDRAPFEYLYLSRRLLTDLFQHEQAARSKWRGSVDINLHFLGLHLQRQAPDFDNLRDLAMRSEALISDQTGSVSHPATSSRVSSTHITASSPRIWVGEEARSLATARRRRRRPANASWLRDLDPRQTSSGGGLVKRNRSSILLMRLACTRCSMEPARMPTPRSNSATDGTTRLCQRKHAPTRRSCLRVEEHRDLLA